MITISKKDFAELKRKHKDYISRCAVPHLWRDKVCNAGDYMAFESVLTGDAKKGTTLIFEHIHFEIV